MSGTKEGTERTLEEVLVDVFDIIVSVRDKYVSELKNAMSSGDQAAIEEVQNIMNTDVQKQLTELGEIEGYQFPFTYDFKSVIDFSLKYEVTINGTTTSSDEDEPSEINHQA